MLFVTDMKPPIKVENNGQIPASSSSNIDDHPSGVKTEIKSEIKGEEKAETIHNITSGGAVVMTKGVIPNQSNARPVGSFAAPTATVKEEEYDSSATVSSLLYYLVLCFSKETGRGQPWFKCTL